MNIIDGKEIAKNLRSKIAEEVSTFERPPGLAVILVGEDPASAVLFEIKSSLANKLVFFLTRLLSPKT